ncbi:NAD(P)-binding protein [Clavulina sp. PMI_390]|nr:NAD(P)-binding protein [Clavulina sp. PMI_390]
MSNSASSAAPVSSFVADSNAKGSVAVITGGSSGIGLAIAKAFLAAGAKGVVISGRSQGRLDSAVKSMQDEYHLGDDTKRVIGVTCDVSSWEENVSLMKTAYETFSQIDYVFANATGGPPGADDESNAKPHDLFAKPDYTYTAAMIDSVNHTVHAAVPYLASRSSSGPINSLEAYNAQVVEGPRRDRAVVVTGSEAAFLEYDPSPQYAVAKGALHTLVWSNRSRFEAIGVRLNCLAPGWVDTALIKPMLDYGFIEPRDCIPMDDVASAAMGLVNTSSISGAIRRIPSCAHNAFDVFPQVQKNFTLAHWNPIIARLKAAAAARASGSTSGAASTEGGQ